MKSEIFTHFLETYSGWSTGLQQGLAIVSVMDNIYNYLCEKPSCFRTVFVNCLHVFWGLSLFHFLCRLQERACQTVLEECFLRVWPSQPPHSFLDLVIKYILSCSSPYFFVAHPVLPFEFGCVSEMFIHKGHLFVCLGLGGPTGFTATKEYRHNITTEDALLGHYCHWCWCPNRSQDLACCSGFSSPCFDILVCYSIFFSVLYK